MPLEQEVVQQAENHKGVFMVVIAWIAHSQIIPKFWKACVAAFPYCKANGGCIGVVLMFLLGRSTWSAPKTTTTIIVPEASTKQNVMS